MALKDLVALEVLVVLPPMFALLYLFVMYMKKIMTKRLRKKIEEYRKKQSDEIIKWLKE